MRSCFFLIFCFLASKQMRTRQRQLDSIYLTCGITQRMPPHEAKGVCEEDLEALADTPLFVRFSGTSLCNIKRRDNGIFFICKRNNLQLFCKNNFKHIAERKKSTCILITEFSVKMLCTLVCLR